MQYILLISAWAVFGLLHSLLAQSRFKGIVLAAMKNNYKYYRLLYSVFATVSLTLVLWYHFSIPVDLIWHNSTAEKATACILSLPAVIIMAICIKKYFADLSGIDVFFKRPPSPNNLEQTGLHRFVRHPLYFGTILLVLCIFLWQPSFGNFISAMCITVYTRIGVYFEEKKLVKEFGKEYTDYVRRVPLLVPGLIKNK